ncbi:MAG: hypothetical protein K5657_09570, partial [Desulfovibrio sp.]|nr:hypothetical protein [Desulfovibrio sp.]
QLKNILYNKAFQISLYFAIPPMQQGMLSAILMNIQSQKLHISFYRGTTFLFLHCDLTKT